MLAVSGGHLLALSAPFGTAVGGKRPGFPPGRLHLPRTSQAERLAKELLDFEIRMDENANERYGAFQVGSQDDLVTALGLAVQPEPVSLGIIVPRSH
jgi:hypothetical protein